MSNSCAGKSASQLASVLESMPQLELCILTVTTHPDYFSFAASWQQVSSIQLLHTVSSAPSPCKG